MTSTRAAPSEAAPLFPPAADLAVAGNEMPPSAPPDLAPPEDGATDWSKSYSGLSQQAFSKEVADVLLTPLESKDIEVKPGTPVGGVVWVSVLLSRRRTDGLLYLPEIKYRRILNRAFGPGAWGLAPRSETNVGPRIVSREYALVCLGRRVSAFLVLVTRP